MPPPAPTPPPSPQPSPPPSPWSDALLALTVFAVDPAGTGVALRAPAGPVRDAWLARLRATLPAKMPVRKMPAMIGAEALLGGLDLSATLNTGRKVAQPGFLRLSDGGVILAAMAERLPPDMAAILAGVLDDQLCRSARDAADGALPCRIGLVALDEGIDEEILATGLQDRLALPLDLSPLSHHDFGREAAASPADIEAARTRLPDVGVPDEVLEALCSTAAALGAGFVRAPLLALRVARAAAALAGRVTVTMEDAAIAARLVLAPRATRLPAEPGADDSQPDEQTPPSAPPTDPDEQTQTLPPDGAEILLEAAKAAIPQGLLERLVAASAKEKRAAAGRAGAKGKGGKRGRPMGVRAAPPGPGLRLSLIETLRAAAPWQRLRAREKAGAGPRVRVRREDFRVMRVEQRTRSTTIFLVDASGSSALNRLAEAKGAVELLLADCYKRRDQVAVLAFRGRDAKILLPPTRSLTRAKRSLAGLPGGGGTPLAAGIDAGFLLAEAVRRAGDTPTLVFLTDGRANVSLSGEGGRARADQDARDASRRLRAAGHRALFVDISPRANDQARGIAAEMGALYIALPYASAAAVSSAVAAASKRL
jgi:magnesium chelatase subunit D